MAAPASSTPAAEILEGGHPRTGLVARCAVCVLAIQLESGIRGSGVRGTETWLGVCRIARRPFPHAGRTERRGGPTDRSEPAVVASHSVVMDDDTTPAIRESPGPVKRKPGSERSQSDWSGFGG